MFVYQLIGRQADTVVDMPFAEAQACMGNGTARRATEEEVTAAMERSTAPVAHMTTEQLLAGYRLEPSEAGGYDAFDTGGVKISTEDAPLRNKLEAEQFVAAYSRRVRGLPEADLFKLKGDGAGAEEVDLSKMKVEDLKALAADRKIDISGLTKKDDIIAAIERDAAIKASLAAGSYDDLTVAELQKVAFDRNIDLTGKTAKADIIEAIKAGGAKSAG